MRDDAWRLLKQLFRIKVKYLLPHIVLVARDRRVTVSST